MARNPESLKNLVPGNKRGPGKVAKQAKDVIAQAADGLGGADRLVEWARENPDNERAFWTSIYPRLVPVQHANDPDNPLIRDPNELDDAALAAIAAGSGAHSSAPSPGKKQLN